MTICKKCYVGMRGMFSGQGFTDMTCTICGKVFTRPNTMKYEVCPECSDKRNICEVCGKPIKQDLTH